MAMPERMTPGAHVAGGAGGGREISDSGLTAIGIRQRYCTTRVLQVATDGLLQGATGIACCRGYSGGLARYRKPVGAFPFES